MCRDRGQYDPAEAQYKGVLAARTARQGADHPSALYCRHKLGVMYRSMKRLDDAIALMEGTVERAKATAHPAALSMQAELGDAYCEARRFADAVPVLEDVRRRGAQDPDLAWVGDKLLAAHVGAGRTAEATSLAREQARTASKELDSLDRPE